LKRATNIAIPTRGERLDALVFLGTPREEAPDRLDRLSEDGRWQIDAIALDIRDEGPVRS
jgi:hypothetical protein